MHMPKLRYPVILCAVVSALSGTVMAQESTDTAAKPEVTDKKNYERIVVTARNREELLNKIPVSVSALAGEQMERTAITGLESIISQTPGVTYDSAGSMGTNTVVIRGMSQPGLVGDETNVAVFIDGIYASGRDASNLPTAGLQRVEVVRGPQSAIYGRNAFSGAINYITKAPSDKFTAGVEATAGSDKMSGIQFYASGGLTDWLAARVDLSHQDSGSTIENIDHTTGEKIDDRLLGRQENDMARISFAFEPMDDMRIKLSHTYLKTDETPRATAHIKHNAGYVVNDFTYELGGPVAYINQDITYNYATGEYEWLSIDEYATAERYKGTVDYDLWNESFTGVPTEATGTQREVNRTNFTVEYDFDSFMMTYLFGYNKTKYRINVGQLVDYSGYILMYNGALAYLADPSAFADAPTIEITDLSAYSGAPISLINGVTGYDIGGQPNDDRTDVSHEIRFTGDMGSLTWATGIFYSKTKLDEWLWNSVIGTDSYSKYILEAAGYGIQEDGNPRWSQATYYETETKSGFFSLGWHLTDDINATVEGRWTREEKYANNYLDNRAVGYLEPTGEMDGDWSYFTPRVTLDWSASDSTMYYFNAGKGTKSGGLNGGGAENEAMYDPEKNWTYELGMKSFFFDGDLRFNLAAYYIDWDDQQVTTFAENDASPTNIVANLGKTEVKGVELDTRWQMTDTLGWTLAAAWNYARVKSGVLSGDYGYLDYEDLGMNGVEIDADDIETAYIIDYIRGVYASQTISAPGEGALVSDGDVSGKMMPRTSRWTVNTGLDYLQDFGAFNGYAELTFSYRSMQYLDNMNITELPAALTAKLVVGAEMENFRVNLFVNNLTDDDTPSTGYRKYLWNSDPQYVAEPRQGRMFGMTVSYKFR